MDYNVLVLAFILCENDPEPTDFADNVSLYVRYALSLLNADVEFTATPAQVAEITAAYPQFSKLSLMDVLHLT